METGHKFINLLENVEIVKIKSNINQHKLLEELEILKEKKKGTNSLMNMKTVFNNEEIFYCILQKD